MIGCLIGLLMITSVPETESFFAGKQKEPGLFDLYFDDEGRVFIGIDRFDEPFLYMTSLATGVGSNDLSLDRGQILPARLVHFQRVGNRVFLIESNTNYRADSDNPAEVEAVRESFASSTLWGEKIHAEEDGTVFVDLGSLCLKDARNLTTVLKDLDEGTYKLDPTRSFYYRPRTRSFPDNTEVEVSLTFMGNPKGEFVPTVVPSPNAISVRQHHSFIRLPPPGYQPRAFHPRCGSFAERHHDYAVPLEADPVIRLIPRFRLEKKYPDRERSEPVKPIVFYIDSGAPAQIREALQAGASWWNQAFEAAGFIDAFRVETLPDGVDPMDVRYNVVQWVHRATRGWSYGTWIMDPRTREIIKGHVTLGSLRVRQDRLIFEGFQPFQCAVADHPLPKPAKTVELSLARIRQLAAHEVGHALGFMHNFAASADGRASVMDYPAPLIRLNGDQWDFSQAYREGIGEWDKLAVRYAYGVYEDEAAGLAQVLKQGQARLFVTDNNAHGQNAAHAYGNLWDNGSDPIEELERITAVRKALLADLDYDHVAPGQPAARLQEVLVPVYLYHRFQIDATGKSLGGYTFPHVSGEAGRPVPVTRERQQRALLLLLDTLNPDFLLLPAHLRDAIPPRPPGYEATRELFDSRAGSIFDPLGLAESAVGLTLDVLLAAPRLNRIISQDLGQTSRLPDYLDQLLNRTLRRATPSRQQASLCHVIDRVVLERLVAAMANPELRGEARALIHSGLKQTAELLENKDETSWNRWMAHQIRLALKRDANHVPVRPLVVPPGSPIGQPGH